MVHALLANFTVTYM